MLTQRSHPFDVVVEAFPYPHLAVFMAVTIIAIFVTNYVWQNISELDSNNPTFLENTHEGIKQMSFFMENFSTKVLSAAEIASIYNINEQISIYNWLFHFYNKVYEANVVYENMLCKLQNTPFYINNIGLRKMVDQDLSILHNIKISLLQYIRTLELSISAENPDFIFMIQQFSELVN